jgi:hypothetical protein
MHTSAEADATATLEILHAQIERYPQLGLTLKVFKLYWRRRLR